MTALTNTQEAAYSAIIDEILATSDLNTISAKRIRKGLQEKVDYDLSEQKDAITKLIMDRFDKATVAKETKEKAGAPEPAPTLNGHGHAKREAMEELASATSPPPSNKRKAPEPEEDDIDGTSDLEDSTPPPKKAKKSKAPKDDEDNDAKLAAKLQAELNAGQRSTRGGGAKRKAPIKKEKKAKKKSKAKIGSDDDSAVEGEEKPEREKKGGFHKPMNLSEPLSAMLGETQLSRPQTVKKIWEYVKARDLQNPKDKRQIICDDAMRAVFKGDSVHMFTMNKLLASHLYPADEVI
ncbi:hypothetical protein DOTSEDRAFT_28327 [Dothistroma septosporum NZE10]|uniref:Uncharacterized protein n=1 Tax=Dothistroma septosporum (strain NZE10 / CBS 128990) TaxID=675120 RepID=M2YJN9_DOTSN|nr:hypothetical protein DOTSEDRAFT_28327 [Dothistroma septosporum NZE10]